MIFAVTLTAGTSLPFAGWLASHRGSRSPTRLGLLIASAGLTLAAFAPSFAVLLPAACILGAGIGTLDVSANAHGVTVENRLGRPVLSALHGAWSFGLLGGAGLGALAAAAGYGPRIIFPVVAAATVAVAAFVTPRLLRGSEDVAVDTARFALPRGALALPAVLLFCCMFVESATMNWAAVFLAGPAHTSAAVAAAGGRRVRHRDGIRATRRRPIRRTLGRRRPCTGRRSPHGRRNAARPRAPVAGAGARRLRVRRRGLRRDRPALFRVAASAPGISSGAGIAAVATAGYTGGVLNGPSIGFLARGVGLSIALGLVAVAGVVIAALGSRLPR